MAKTWIKTLLQDKPEGDSPINKVLDKIQQLDDSKILDVKISFAINTNDGTYVYVYLITYESNLPLEI